MKWKIAVFLVSFVIIGVPMLAVNLGALGMQARMEKLINGQSHVPDPVADAGDVVLDLWGDFKEGREIDALFVADRFTRKRSIEYREIVSINDMLGEGEKAPAPEFEELWVLARAPQRVLERECPVALETIARSCAVSTAKVEARKDGTYEIEAVVGYLPDNDLGSTEVEGPRALYRAYMQLPGRGGISVRPEASDAAKRSLYLEIEHACDKMRETRGNCVIADLRFQARSANADGTVPYFASASLYTVGPEGSGKPGDDLVGTYGGSTFAQGTSGNGEKFSLLASIQGLFGSSSGGAKNEGPTILRGGHTRYGGNDGRFIPAKER